MNIWKEMKKNRIKDIQRLTKPVDAMPLIEIMMDKNLSDKKRKEILDTLVEGHKKTGEILLHRCYIENVMTEEEWKDMKEKYNLTEADISPVLQGYFNSKDNLNKDDEIVVVTMENSSLFKHRDVFKKKFGVKIINPKEGIEMMKKEEKNIMKKKQEKKPGENVCHGFNQEDRRIS